ncbi:amidase [Pacificibacter marinus]|uniref:amidase n=1 Tax=Pacificibacter marinus TaxID=658057 RepID=UPI001C073072|nr:amidase [Pacificibacter marinus]MBU2866035.1 amidase [Pacificibacter marinus]
MTVVNDTYCALAHTLDMGEGALRVAIKDCIDIQGTVSACGSAALRSSPPAQKNAAVVDALLARDCTIIGKANMHELAYGMTGVNAAFGTPINPKWPDRIPGGSSSGSAVAVAAGLCDFSVGSDTGGSVRQPAICCGVYGIKPSFGRVSRDGCHPTHSSLDCIGVFARSIAMIETGMEAIDPSFTRVSLTKPLRMARIDCSAAPEIQTVIDRHFGAEPVIPLPQMSAAFEAGMTLIGIEAISAYGTFLEQGDDLGSDVRARLENAAQIHPRAFVDAENMRTQFTNEVDAALEQFDVLLTPALPIIPPTLLEAADPATVLPLTKFLRPFNLSGHPAIVLPFTAGPQALPAGLQLIGRKGEDAFLCAAAHKIASILTEAQRETTP